MENQVEMLVYGGIAINKAQWEGSLALLFLQEVSSSGEKNNELPGWMGSWIY